MIYCPACGYRHTPPEPLGLTAKQRELAEFIRDHNYEHGVSPSYDQMKDALGLKSKSGVHRIVLGLEERGWITRIPDRARSIVLVGQVA